MPVALPIIAAVAAVASTAVAVVSGNQARAQQRHANDLQMQAADQQRAQQAQNEADAARQQYRQDRVNRARIMQMSSNSGTEASSGEIGSLGSLQTQYSVNQGTIAGNYDRASSIGTLMTGANQSIFQAQQDLSSGRSLSTIFDGIGSAANMGTQYYGRQMKIAGTTPQPLDYPQTR